MWVFTNTSQATIMNAKFKQLTASGYQPWVFLSPWIGGGIMGLMEELHSVELLQRQSSKGRSRVVSPIRNAGWPGISRLSHLIMQPTNQQRTQWHPDLGKPASVLSPAFGVGTVPKTVKTA
jgi:hypothetical protein